MSFWNLSDNTEIEKSGEFESGGGEFEPLPNNTDCLAAVDEAKWGWDIYEGEEYISLRWVILKPDGYKGRRIFQKIKVNESDSKKADKAKRMLAAIDTNAGGKLMASGEAPTDMSLMQSLSNKPMVIKLMIWEIDGKRGNWVSKVSPKNGELSALAPAPVPVKKEVIEDDDVPF